MARRVEPQVRDGGGRFAKRTAAPSTVEHGGEHGDEHGESTVPSTVEHGDAPVIEYPPPPSPRAARSQKPKRTVQAGKKPKAGARSRTVKPTVPSTVEHGDEHGGTVPSTATARERPLGFLAGLTSTVTRG